MACTELNTFVVATDRGEWGKAPTLAEAKRHAFVKKGVGYTVFASNQPLAVEADLACRVYAEPGAVLVKFRDIG